MDTDLCTILALRTGERVAVRPVLAGDKEGLGDLFLSLSSATRRVYGPHPFDRETARRLCETIDESVTLRFVAAVDDGRAAPRIIGYMILTRELGAGDLSRYGDRIRRERCAAFAPVIADAYQNQGLGTRMARHVLACARQIGLEQVILMGGVRDDNPRAQRMYEKLGFRRVGEFWVHSPETVLNYDMILDLEPAEPGGPASPQR